MAVLMGFASFAVDVGHVMLVNTELQRACDAGARAGAGILAGIQSGNAKTAAQNVANENYVDGLLISSTGATVTAHYIDWISSSNYTVLSSSSGANAVQVTITYPVSMMFASLFHITSHTASKSSIAAVVTNSETDYVSAYSNPWLAGMPTGTTGSLPDGGYSAGSKEHPWQYDLAGPPGTHAASGQPYSSPLQANVPIIPGATISVSSVSGNAVNDLTLSDDYSANGSINGDADAGGNYVDEAATGGGVSGEGTETDTGSENHIANSKMPLNSLNGVFLTNAEPDTQTAPAVTDFSTSAEQNYTTFNPLSQQVFYIGTGETNASTPQQQSFTVPTNATRLFLGTMDGHEWSNNLGGYTVTITETSIQLVQ
jgi:Flp pilus assembly protein TadG